GEDRAADESARAEQQDPHQVGRSKSDGWRRTSSAVSSVSSSSSSSCPSNRPVPIVPGVATVAARAAPTSARSSGAASMSSGGHPALETSAAPAMADAGGSNSDCAISQQLTKNAAMIGPITTPAIPNAVRPPSVDNRIMRSEEHTSELQSRENLVCRLLL